MNVRAFHAAVLLVLLNHVVCDGLPSCLTNARQLQLVLRHDCSLSWPRDAAGQQYVDIAGVPGAQKGPFAVINNSTRVSAGAGERT